MNMRSELQEGETRTKNVSKPTFAIFTLPKPFDDPHITLIQRNAIASWQALSDESGSQLGGGLEIILMGEEDGVAETAAELNVRYAGAVERNDQGTPLISSAFAIAKAASTAEVLIYCNADVILLNDFKNALLELQRSALCENFLAIGRRTNLDLDRPINFRDRMSMKWLLEKTKAEGTLAAIVCKEYFAFPRELFDQLPPFAVGRGNWDNWMVTNAKRHRIAVVDLSQRVTAIHQNHDYQHIKSRTNNRRRKHCYLSGSEAQENQRLAGGRHIISGSTASHRLTSDGVVKNRCSNLNLKFWADLLRFARLVRQLFLS